MELKNGVVKLPIGHMSGADLLLVQRAKLQPAQQVGALVQRRVLGFEGAPDFRRRVFPFVAHLVDEEVHALRSGHFLQVKAQRENDAGRPVRSPKQHPDPVFRRLRETEIP